MQSLGDGMSSGLPPLCVNPTNLPPNYRARATPPFRSGGRGSKQLSKALQENGGSSAEISWVLCTGKTTYFAKVISVPTENTGNVLLQPLLQSSHDPSLLKCWEGNLWLAKREKLHPVQMHQEPGGWRVIETPTLNKLMEKSTKGKGSSSPYLSTQPFLTFHNFSHSPLHSLHENQAISIQKVSWLSVDGKIGTLCRWNQVNSTRRAAWTVPCSPC